MWGDFCGPNYCSARESAKLLITIMVDDQVLLGGAFKNARPWDHPTVLAPRSRHILDRFRPKQNFHHNLLQSGLVDRLNNAAGATSRLASGRVSRLRLRSRMGGRAVEGTGLENRRAGNRLVGSNPTPSAMALAFVRRRPRAAIAPFAVFRFASSSSDVGNQPDELGRGRTGPPRLDPESLAPSPIFSCRQLAAERYRCRRCRSGSA